ncbi:hypothetical protein CSOJ01_11122 [Colletotrichum sojae]|uniref:Uncharacterized protein n=1 Tax=Colletotrichum sojae TaxID=2175907 RepID=A0A8H6MNH3_9PEZI|nr:hypothetical protein CSOJ01_11122 [Colletotrichum sojae]
MREKTRRIHQESRAGVAVASIYTTVAFSQRTAAKRLTATVPSECCPSAALIPPPLILIRRVSFPGLIQVVRHTQAHI